MYYAEENLKQELEAANIELSSSLVAKQKELDKTGKDKAVYASIIGGLICPTSKDEHQTSIYLSKDLSVGLSEQWRLKIEFSSLQTPLLNSTI